MGTDESVRRVDKNGSPFSVSALGRNDPAPLLDMYNTFFPETETQGLPPLNRHVRLSWVNRLLQTGENFVAWRQDKPIGHAALLPDMDARNGEYLIFVGRPHRAGGVATELTRLVIERAREMGLEKVWLLVAGGNFRAIKLYEKFGFTFQDTGMWERTMVLHLSRFTDTFPSGSCSGSNSEARLP